MINHGSMMTTFYYCSFIYSIWNNEQNFFKIDMYNFNSLSCAAIIHIDFELLKL